MCIYMCVNKNIESANTVKSSQKSEHHLKSTVSTKEENTLILRMPEQSLQSCFHTLKEKVHIMCLAMSNLLMILS